MEELADGFGGSHTRTIIHLDIDCFYAQVEELRRPDLRGQPIGVVQKSLMITCNYEARALGAPKHAYVQEVKKICPSIVLVNGEDLSPYRDKSQQFHDLLRSFSPSVEKMGFDENFVDVSNLVQERLSEKRESEFVGVVEGTKDSCSCGCIEKLRMGSIIAAEMRESILAETGLTCCAGVAYNKLLAKLAGGQNKPNNQTTVLPDYIPQLLAKVALVKSIPGIGHATCNKLDEIGVKTMADLQSCSTDDLVRVLGSTETADKVKQWSYGIDESEVKSTGLSQRLGVEDAVRKCFIKTECVVKLNELVQRLLKLVLRDGRIPSTLKLTVARDTTESRQCPLPRALFQVTPPLRLRDNAQERLEILVENLLDKIVAFQKPTFIAVLGLSVTNFQKLGSNQKILNYFQPDNTVAPVNHEFKKENQRNAGFASASEKPQHASEASGSSASKGFPLSNFKGATARPQGFSGTSGAPSDYEMKALCQHFKFDSATFSELPEVVQAEFIKEWKTLKSKEKFHRSDTITKYLKR